MQRDRTALPHHTLTSYDTVEVALPAGSVSERLVDDEIARTLRAHARHERVAPRTIRDDDIVHLAIESTRDGDPYPRLTTPGHDLELGCHAMPDAFERQLLGLSVGETATISFDLPGMGEATSDGSRSPLHLDSTVTVLELRRRVVPALTDAWMRENITGMSTVAEFRAGARLRLENRRREELLASAPIAAADVLATRLVDPLPDEAVREALGNSTRSFLTFLKQQGISKERFLEQERITSEQFEKRLQEETRQMVAQGLALLALAEHLDLEVTQEEIDATFGEDDPGRAAEARRACEEAGMLPRAHEAALRVKSMGHLLEMTAFKLPDGTKDTAFRHQLLHAYGVDAK